MNRKVRVVINSIKKIFLIIKWFFVWVYRKTELQKSMEKTGFTVMSCNFDHDRLCYILEI